MDSNNPTVIRKGQRPQQQSGHVGVASGSDDSRPSLGLSKDAFTQTLAPPSVRHVLDTKSTDMIARNRSQYEEEEAIRFHMLELEAEEHARQAARGRECPVPKPRGILGRMLGIQGNDGGDGVDERRSQLRPSRREVDVTAREVER